MPAVYTNPDVIGYMPMPASFHYRSLFLQGRPRHEKYDEFWRKHPPMDHVHRAKIFAPFDALTPLAIDEFNGPRGDFYKNMFAKCPAGRPGTADEMANIAELLMSDAGAFITGSTFLADGGATASYYYGPLQPTI